MRKCSNCSRAALPNRALCFDCDMSQKQSKRRRRASRAAIGLCAQCDHPNVDGRLCADHTLLFSEPARRNRMGKRHCRSCGAEYLGDACEWCGPAEDLESDAPRDLLDLIEGGAG